MPIIEPITSAENKQIKLLKKLGLKKYREESGLFMVENLTIIHDALKSGIVPQGLFITTEFKKRQVAKLFDLFKLGLVEKIYEIDARLNKIYSQLETPSGITAVYEIKERELIKNQPIIYLNGIGDPGNLGTIMRTALAFDFVNLIVDETCVDIYNFKTINAAKDAIFKVNIISDKNQTWLKKNKKKLPFYAAEVSGGTDINKFKPGKNFCLILGSESHGLSPEVKKLVDKNINIKISDKIESLNVASAAAILFYELKPKK